MDNPAISKVSELILQAIVAKVEEVITDGFGEVVIKIQHNEVKLIQIRKDTKV